MAWNARSATVERGTRDLDAALVEQHAVLEAGSTSRVGRRRVEVDLRAEQRRERVHG